MATRTTGIVRRFLSSPMFSAHSSPFSATSTAAIHASPNGQNDDEPEIAPSTTLHISGLSKRTTAKKIQEEFSKFGDVVDVRLVINRYTGFSRGYGFVKYANLEEAKAAKKGMDLQFIEGWRVFTEYAKYGLSHDGWSIWELAHQQDDKRFNDSN